MRWTLYTVIMNKTKHSLLKQIFFSLNPGKREKIILLTLARFHMSLQSNPASCFSAAYSVSMFTKVIGCGWGSLSGLACCFFVLCDRLPSHVPDTRSACDCFQLSVRDGRLSTKSRIFQNSYQEGSQEVLKGIFQSYRLKESAMHSNLDPFGYFYPAQRE